MENNNKENIAAQLHYITHRTFSIPTVTTASLSLTTSHPCTAFLCNTCHIQSDLIELDVDMSCTPCPPRCFIKYELTYLDVLTRLHFIFNSYKPPSYSSLLTLTTVHLLHLSPHKSTFNPSLKLDFKHKKGNKTQEPHMVNIK